jgi:deazaflavin-dependent oxidoreductase (nitroreductase family)
VRRRETVRDSRIAADDFCYLTTTGRVTGRPHEIEIWYARAGETLYLLSGGGDRSDWVCNLMAESSCTVRIGHDRETVGARGRVLTADSASGEEIETARRLVFDKYQARYDGDLSDWRERALPVAIDLLAQET